MLTYYVKLFTSDVLMCPDFCVPARCRAVLAQSCHCCGALLVCARVHSTDERSRSLRRRRVQVRKSPAHGEQSAPVVDELKGGDYNSSQLQGATAYDKR